MAAVLVVVSYGTGVPQLLYLDGVFAAALQCVLCVVVVRRAPPPRRGDAYVRSRTSSRLAIQGEHVPSRSFTAHVLITAKKRVSNLSPDRHATPREVVSSRDLAGQDRSGGRRWPQLTIAFNDAEETEQDPSDATATVGVEPEGDVSFPPSASGSRLARQRASPCRLHSSGRRHRKGLPSVGCSDERQHHRYGS